MCQVRQSVCRLRGTRRLPGVRPAPAEDRGRRRRGSPADRACCLDHVPDAVLAQLREAGSLERTAAGALGSVVSLLEAFLRQTFLDRAAGGAALIAGKGNVFQRLDDVARLYWDHLVIDLPGAIGTAEWDKLRLLYGIRHLITHTNGVVDQRHLDRFPGRGFVLVQRLHVTMGDAREAILLARKIIAAVP